MNYYSLEIMAKQKQKEWRKQARQHRLARQASVERLNALSFIRLGFVWVLIFGLGAAKVLVTRLNPLRSGIEMLLVGGLAAAVAYVVGALLKGING